MSNEEKTHDWKYTWMAIIIVLVFSFLISAFCYIAYSPKSKFKPTATVQPIIDHKQNMIDSLLLTVNRLVESVNSSKQSIIIQRDGFTNTYQSSLQNSPEICLPIVKTMYRQAMQMDSTNQTIIRKQDSTLLNYSKVVGEYSDIMALQKFQIQQKTDSINQLKELQKIDRKLARRERIKQTLTKIGLSTLSFGAGYGTSKIIP
jgi:uncharacterized membrane protein